MAKRGAAKLLAYQQTASCPESRVARRRAASYHNETGAPTWSNRSKSMRVNTPFGHICNVYGLQLRIVATMLACLHACWPACRLACLPTYLAPRSALLFRHMSSGRQSAKRLSAVRLNILFICDGHTVSNNGGGLKAGSLKAKLFMAKQVFK